MRRRDFILAMTLLPIPTVAGALDRPIRIGWMNTASPESSGAFLEAFEAGLKDFGWANWRDYVIEQRWVRGRYDQLDGLALDLLHFKPDVIVAAPLQSTEAAARVAPKIPIIQADGGDLVRIGLATSLARPSGHVTGLTNIAGDVVEKHLEMLLQIATPRCVGFLSDPGNLNLPVMMEAVERSLRRFPIKSSFVTAKAPSEIEPGFKKLESMDVDALIVLKSAMFRVNSSTIAAAAIQRGWPVITEEAELAKAGALIAYGHDSLQNYRRAAYYVKRISEGASPGELPIEQPNKITLIINQKTSRRLKVSLPQAMLLAADEVIE